MRQFLQTTIRMILLILVIGLLWGGWYVNRRGFTRNWREFVNSEFEKRGVSVSIDRLTLDPLHGLIARDVEIYDVKGHRRVLAVISQVVLDLDFSKLLHRQAFLKGLDLRNTILTLPIDPSNPSSARVPISHLNALVRFPQDVLDIRKADARIFGIHVTVTGRLIHPEALHLANPDSTTGSSGGTNTPSGLIASIIERITALKYESTPPELDISFLGDAREPDKIFAEATLHGENIASGNYGLENIHCVLNYQDGVLNLKKCVANDNTGSFDASGKWEGAKGLADFQLRSTLNIQALSHAFRLAPALDEFVFYDPPTIEVSGEFNARNSPPFILMGNAGLKKFGFRSVMFEGFDANFSWDGNRWYARDIHLDHRTGTISAKAMQLPKAFRADLQSSINPGVIIPILPPKAAEPLSEFNFLDSPNVHLSILGPALDFAGCVVTGELQLGRAVLRGSLMERAECKLFIKDRAVTYHQFKIERGGGVGTGSFTYDFAKHEVRLDKIQSTISPQDAAPWVNPDIIKSVAPYRFKTRPNLSINGVVQLNGGKKTNLEILVDAPGGMDYVFLKKNLSFSSISGRLLFTDNHLKISDINASIFSGRAQGDAEISLDRNTPDNSATINARDINFAKLTKLYFDYDDSQGNLNGSYSFSIRSDDARTMQGKGQLTVTNGNIFAIPFLGPFTGILNSIVPGMGYDVARKATADFRVSDGTIDTSNFLVTGRGFNMLGRGKLFFLDDKMNFAIRINAQGLPGVLLLPVSELFEYVSDASLSKPVWRPKRLPSL